MQFPELPQTPLGVLRNSQCSIIRLDDMRFLINTSAAHATALWPVLTQNARTIDHHRFGRLDRHIRFYLALALGGRWWYS